MVLKLLRHIIEKITEGSIGRYRYVAFEATPDEVKKFVRKARIAVAEVLDDVLFDYGVPESEAREYVRQVEKGVIDPHEALWELGIEPDWYIPDVEEVAASYAMSEALSRSMIPDAPTDASAFEEVGYGLPEYSLYYGPDARSWRGRWYWSERRVDPEDVCFMLVREANVCEKITDIVSKLEKDAERKGRQLFFAVWERT